MCHVLSLGGKLVYNEKAVLTQLNNTSAAVELRLADRICTFTEDGFPAGCAPVARIYEPRREKTGLRGFRRGSNTNQAVQPQNMVRGLKFVTYGVEGLYYPFSENKGADQLRGDREADLHLCFRKCKKPVFSRRGSYRVLT